MDSHKGNHCETYMRNRSLNVLGVELGDYVTNWNQVDDTKDLLLAQTQLFAGSGQVTLAGSDAMFSPYAPTSLFYGRPMLNQLAVISLDGVVVYNGLIKSINMDGQQRTVTLNMENYFSKPTSIIASLVASNANPTAAMASLFQNAGLSNYLDLSSFNAAGAGASAAGATIGVSYSGTSSTSLLSAIQSISQLSSISVYVSGGLIRAKLWTPYQGNGAGIKGTIDSSLAREWTDFTQAFDNLNNSVTIGYGASSTVTLQNTASIAANGITVNFPFSTNTGSLTVPNLTSAQYFGNLFLARASTLRSVVQVECGLEMQSAQLGDRYFVTSPNLGMTKVPMEIIETHLKIMDDGIALKLTTI